MIKLSRQRLQIDPLTRGFYNQGYQTSAKVPLNDVTLGYPAGYEDVLMAQNPSGEIKTSWFNDPVNPGHFWKGGGFMYDLHKARDEASKKQVMDKLQSTRSSDRRYTQTYNGFGNLPKPIKSVKYAAASYGANANPASEDQDGPFRISYNGPDAWFGIRENKPPVDNHVPETWWGIRAKNPHMPLSGGVLRSKEGQIYAKQLLDNRIINLNEMDALAKEQKITKSKLDIETKNLAKDTIELNLLLQGVLDSLSSIYDESKSSEDITQLSAFAMKDASRAMQLILSLTPKMDMEEMQDTSTKVDEIVSWADVTGRDIKNVGETGIDLYKQHPKGQEISKTLFELFSKLRIYLSGMINGIPALDAATQDVPKYDLFGQPIYKIDPATGAQAVDAAGNLIPEMVTEQVSPNQAGISGSDMRYKLRKQLSDALIKQIKFDRVLKNMNDFRRRTEDKMKDIGYKPIDRTSNITTKTRFNRDPRDRFGDRSGTYFNEDEEEEAKTEDEDEEAGEESADDAEGDAAAEDIPDLSDIVADIYRGMVGLSETGTQREQHDFRDQIKKMAKFVRKTDELDDDQKDSIFEFILNFGRARGYAEKGQIAENLKNYFDAQGIVGYGRKKKPVKKKAVRRGGNDMQRSAKLKFTSYFDPKTGTYDLSIKH